jgi:hypothetical protein
VLCNDDVAPVRLSCFVINLTEFRLISSSNGSPVESHEVGTVVATVTKKRRGNDNAAANFEINVGEGRVFNLNDPMDVNQLDSGMKATAATQLKVLQDQMASLMAQLTK